MLFNKSNGGLSSARNYAIPFVKGEYIAFLDSDDYVSEDAYEKLYDMSENGARDIVMENENVSIQKGITLQVYM